jgi:filamentous hemagglutinin family protein
MSQMARQRVKITLGLSVSLLALVPSAGYANPQDPTVQAGNVTFSESGPKLDVYQSSGRAVIDWRSFNIDAGEHTEFHQPSTDAFTLNRVNSNDPSYINGMLSANGNIAVINPNGVYFGGGSRIDVGGLIATTTDIDNNDFMNGTMNFALPGTAGAKIVNEGHITAREGGLVGLVAPSVENRGIIEARLGKVQLESGDTFTLDMAGDGLINLAIDEDQARTILNEGTIRADGGSIVMSVATARDNVDALVVNKGTLSANSVGMNDGRIVLSAGGANGTAKTGVSTVLNEGTIQAAGDDAGEAGGHVHLLGDHVGAMAGSSVDAHGESGGGEILLGGDYQGGGDTPTAARIYVDAGAHLDARATQTGDGGKVVVWADDVTRYYGDINVDGGAQSGNGGLIEVSGKNYLDFAGTVSTQAANGEAGTLLLDPTDLTISNAVNNNVNGATPFSPNLDDGPSNLNVTTLQTALAGANVTVQTRATGTQLGDITVVDPIAWSANRSLTLDAHNKIYINAPITARNALTLTANDVDINANLIEHASGANLTIQPKTASTTIGVAGGAGLLNLSNADLDFIQSGWNNIIIGATNGTGIMDVGARAWNAPLTLRSSTGELRINGMQTMGGNALALTTRNLSINADISGTGTLTIDPGANVTVGIAGQAGTLNISTAELDHILNGFSSITIGRAANTQTQRVGAYTWNDPLTLRTATGQLNIVGTQTMGANNLTLATRNLAASADLVGTGTITIQPDGNQTVGVAGGAGTFQITNAFLDHIADGWAAIAIGLNSSTQAMNIGARTWVDPVQYYNGTGLVSVTGAQDMGANNLLVSSRGDVAINAPLTGTGVLTLRPVLDTVSTGVAGGAGTFNLSTADLDNITDGWTRIDIGLSTNDQPINVNAYTWRDSVRFLSDNGVITINGAQNVGANDLFLLSDANPVINAPLIGSGTLDFQTAATNTTVGVAGGAGTFNLSTADLGQIADGWNQISIGRTNSTVAMNVNAYTWLDSVLFQSSTGVITIAGNQDVGNNNLRIRSSANPVINGTLTGSGALTLDTMTASTTIGVGGGAGTYNISAAELNNITDGWANIIIGNTAGTGAMVVNGRTWNDNLRLQTSTGVITIAGAQNLGSNDLTIQSSGNPAINADIIGTGALSLFNNATNTTIGLAGGTGTFNLSVAELNHILDGWSQITVGQSNGTGTITANAYTWNDPLHLQRGTGAVTIAGAQTMGANDLMITGDSIAVNAALNGSGTLTMQQGSANRSVGLAGGSGSYNLTAGELNNITDGWGSIIIGRNDTTAAININAYTWNDDVTLRGGSGQMRFIGAQDFGANNATLETDNLRIDQNMTGSGDLVIAPSDATTSIGLAGGAGTLNLSAAELDMLVDGWNSITIGRADGTGAIALDTYTNWSDPLRVVKDATNLANELTIAGVQSITGASNASLTFDANTRLNADVTTDNTDLSFGGPVTLGANSVLTTGTGAISFGGTLNGSFDLDIVSSGDVDFTGATGLNARLAHVTITGAHDVNAGDFRADTLTLSGATGLATFTGADITNLVDMDAEGIEGSYTAATGDLDSKTGVINATTSFGTLNIRGGGATLLAGYIGAAGTPTQDMANLITINGVLMPVPSASYTFDGFEIGTAPPAPQNNIINTILQSFIPLEDSNPFSQFSFASFQQGQEGNGLILGAEDSTMVYPKIIDGVLYADPSLELLVDSSALLE